MISSNKLLQALGIPLSAILSVIFGLFLISFPIGAFVIFDSDIGGDISHDLPISHLDIFYGTDFYQSTSEITIGDAFASLWAFYAVIFAVAVMGPRHNFLQSLSPIITHGRIDSSNYMLGVTKWLSILVLVSILITYAQDWFGIPTTHPPAENDLVQFFYVSLAPIIEEIGFRVILIGVPLFMWYSRRASITHLFWSLWNPSNLRISYSKKPILLAVLAGIMFGFAHVAFDGSWSDGKFAQATAGGIILGWTYLRYGFVASLLVHWATNYVIFAYANFISQVNSISIESAFAHSLMSSVELLLVTAGAMSVAILLANRFCIKRYSD